MFRALVAVLSLVGATWFLGEGGQTWDFESEVPGRASRGFTSAVGQWEVAMFEGGKVLAQRAKNPDATFNVVLVNDTSARDLDLSVRIRPVAGVDDQGGGLIWRARDAQNYYIARYNPLEDNFRVYKVVDGKRTMFQDAPAPRASGWRTIRVVARGTHIACYLDDIKRLELDDATFPGAGKIGLWSKADAQTDFDDLTLKE
jgi:hypothetical protein